MAKRKKNRKPTLNQLKEKLENVKERSMFRLAMTLNRKGGKMTKRNRKRQKDAKNGWRRDHGVD